MEPAPPEPEVEMTDDVAALLDEAEDIVNAAGIEMMEKRQRSAVRKGMFRKRKKR